MARPRSVLRPGLLPVVLAAGGLALAGCGVADPGTPEAGVRTTAPAAPSVPSPPPGGSGPATPNPPTGPSDAARRLERRLFPGIPPLARIPQEATGPADAEDRAVAERWFALVRAGRDARAARLMRDGTRFANVDVLLLRDGAARRAAAESLPCGARPTDVGGARGGYVVLSLVLTDKVGRPPCDGAGSAVAVALHVTDGRIDDWVRVRAADAPVNRGAPA